MQRQTAVTAHFPSEQLLLSAFAGLVSMEDADGTTCGNPFTRNSGMITTSMEIVKALVVNPSSAGTVFIRQNLTSVDGRF